MKMNIKNSKICASCKYWDDPTRSAMKPTMGTNIWDIDDKQRKFCLKRKAETRATYRCPYHSMKIEIL